MKQTWEFTAIDTLFFRESRPMESPGSSELNSLFPPPIRTIAGAIRTCIGENMGVDWTKFKNGEQPEISSVIGKDGNDYADLTFQGVWIHYKGQRLYPAPLNLMALRNDPEHRDKITCLDELCIGSPRVCDLGGVVTNKEDEKSGTKIPVRLACLPKDMEGGKPLQDSWLTANGLKKVLTGKVKEIDKKNDIIILEKSDKSDYSRKTSSDPADNQKTLLKQEHRLGIAIDNQTKIVREGLLYQTRHIRLNKETSFCVDVDGHKGKLKPGIVKLGGEGRMADLQLCNANTALPIAPPFSESSDVTEGRSCQGIILYLLTPMLLPKGSRFLPGFTENTEDPDCMAWQGTLYNISLNLISCVIGKAQREGGWDVVEHKPRDVQSMIPAGSVFYCQVPGKDITTAINTLNERQQIGDEQHLGRGHIAAGVWLA